MSGESTQQDREPESLAERLEYRYGPSIDPSITLQRETTPTPAELSPLGSFAGHTPSGATPSSGELQKELLDLAVFDPKRRRYVPRGEIGRGGMGAVIEVWDRHLRRTLAMKVALEAKSDESDGEAATLDSKRVSRFLEEAQVTSQLDHPGIVPVHEIGMDPSGRVFFTMRRVAGRDLKAIFDLACASCEGWTKERVLGVLIKVCETLAYAHSKGVIHRDLKPANIMIGAFGEVYVMDWGLAKVLGQANSAPKPEVRESVLSSPNDSDWIESDRAQLLNADPGSELATMAGEIVGTPCYMAPEQAQRDRQRIGPHCDTYAVGCLLYQLLTERRPYVPDERRTNAWEVLQALRKGPPVRIQKLERRASPELVAICEKAMEREPEERYADLTAMASDLRAYLEGRVVRAHAVGPWIEFKKWVGRNKAFATACAAAFLTVIGSALFFALEQQDHAALVEGQRREAETARIDAERSEAEALRQNYAATIAAAAAALRGAEVREARRRLEETPTRMRGWEWHHLALQADGSLLQGEMNGGARIIAHHPREAFFAVGDANGEIHLLDAQSGAVVRHFTAHEREAISALAWSPDGKRLASGAVNGGLRIWSIEGGAPLVLGGHANRLETLNFNARGTRLLSAAADLELRLWDAASGAALAQAKSDEEGFRCAIFAPGPGDAVLAAAGDRLYTWVPERQLLTEAQTYPAAITALAASPDGDVLIGLRTGAVLRSSRRRGSSYEGHADQITALGVSADGKWLASASSDRTLRVWNLERGERLPRVLMGHVEAVTSLSFGERGETLVSGSEDGSWRVWSLDACEALTRAGGHEKAVHALAFSPDGAHLLSAGLDGSAAIWNPSSGSLNVLLRSADDALTSAVYAADGQMLATGASDGTVRLWDPRRAENTRVLSGHLMGVHSLAASPDGALIASGSWDGSVRLWNWADGSPRAQYDDHLQPVTGIAFHPGGRWIASSDRGGRIVVRDLSSGRIERSFVAHDGWIGGIAFHPELPWLASGGGDETVRLWDVSDGSTLAVFLGHDAAVHSVAFNRDGTRLASGSADRTVRVWSPTARTALLALRGHAEAVTCVAFSPDGTQLASASADGAVRCFETRSAKARHADHEAEAALRIAAAPRVDRLFNEYGLASDVIDALRSDPNLSEALRAASIALAFERALSPRELNRRAWTIVRQPNQDPKRYAEALRIVHAARRGAFDDPQVLSTLGATLYRNGNPSGALEVLRQADRLNRARSGGSLPADIAFLALAQWQLGQHEAARRELERLEALLKDAEQGSDTDAMQLLEQVHAIVR